MGGTGSGRWNYHNKKRTVEECWTISISEVAHVVDLRDPGPASNALRPTRSATGKGYRPYAACRRSAMTASRC